MAGPSAPKNEIRCVGMLKTGKRKGDPCHGLLVKKDGTIACHNCGEPRSLLDVLGDAITRGIISKEAAITTIEPNQRNGGKEMVAMVAQVKTKTELLREWIAKFADDIDPAMRAKAHNLVAMDFDPDRIERILGMPLRLGDKISLGAKSDDYIRFLVLQFRVKNQPDVPVELSLAPFYREALQIYLRVGHSFKVVRKFIVQEIYYYDDQGAIQFWNSPQEKPFYQGVGIVVHRDRVQVLESGQDEILFHIPVDPVE